MLEFGKIFSVQKYEPLSEELVKEYNLHRPYGNKEYLCYVPWRMMYFAFNGDVIACCHNRDNILGKYPQQSIKSIWNGAKINRLRKFIKNNDLNFGCTVCKDQIVCKNFAAAKPKMYDHYPLPKNKFPSVMEFELDNTCNFECIMCTGVFCSLIRKNREKKEILKSPYDNKFVKQLEKFIPYLEEAKFYGGEPFLINIYYEIWKKMIELNPSIKFMIQTNGSVLNDKVKGILSKGFFNINVSIDSFDKANFESIRKHADFDQVMNNIEYFRNYCKDHGTFFSLVATPIRQNWKDLHHLILECNKIGVPVYFNTIIFPYRNALWNLGPDDLTDIYNALSPLSLPEDSEIEKGNKAVFDGFLKQIMAWKNENVIRCKEKNKNIKITLDILNEAKEIFYTNLRIRFLKDYKKNMELISRKFAEYEHSINSKAFRSIPLQFKNIIYLELNKLKMDDMLKVLESDHFDEILENSMISYCELENNNFCL